MPCCAGAVVASLLPLPSAKALGVDSAGADACESESHSTSLVDTQTGQDDIRASESARYCFLLYCGYIHPWLSQLFTNAVPSLI